MLTKILKIVKVVLRNLTLPYYLYGKVVEDTFVFGNKRYQYLYHLHSYTYLNERAVEIPIAIRKVKEFQKKNPSARILEVGDTVGHYYDFEHDIVDKFPDREGVIGEDILKYKPKRKYDFILSVSSMEHVGWDEYIYGGKSRQKMDKQVFVKLLKHLVSLLADDGVLFFTVPLGYSDFVDQCLAKEQYPFRKLQFMKRSSVFNKWKETEYSEAKNEAYNKPLLHANAVAICTIVK